MTELERESKEVARLTLVESEVQRLKVELDEVQAKLKSTVLELGKTQARNKTMERHEQVSDGPTCTNSFQPALLLMLTTFAALLMEFSFYRYSLTKLNKTCSDCVFTFAVPNLWNALPLHI